jgi:hypothetical protein
VLPFGNKRIEGERGIHHGSSMWEEVEVCTQGEIVPERFQMGHVVWVQVSWRGKEFKDWWLLAKPYLRPSTGRTF